MRAGLVARLFARGEQRAQRETKDFGLQRYMVEHAGRLVSRTNWQASSDPMCDVRTHTKCRVENLERFWNGPRGCGMREFRK